MRTDHDSILTGRQKRGAPILTSHDLVVALKELAAELGVTPTRSQFEGHVKGGKYQLEKHFRTYSALCESAGLAPARAQKVTNAVFEKSVTKHLEEYTPQEYMAQNKSLPPANAPYPKTNTISDIHWPFCNDRVIEKFLSRIETVQPEHVIINGDAWDMYSHAKFPRSHNLFTPREEQACARKLNEEFWREVRKRCPNAKLYQTMGNHDVRPLKRTLETYPAIEDWVAKILEELFTFDGVQTIFDYRQELLIGNVLWHHGYRSKIGDHRDYVLYNIIVGHTHLAGVSYRQVHGQTLFEMNCGLAGDPHAKGLTYTPQKMTHWTPAFSETDPSGPRVILC